MMRINNDEMMMMVVDLCCSITSSQCILPLPQDHPTRDFRQVHRLSSRLSQFEVVPNKDDVINYQFKGEKAIDLVRVANGML